ncbi:MAG: hypothetical protein IJV91_08370 [Kiritimatiellae bacterium]|nr:hypothetical protein [Kiritimatiellia bacterium]
MATAIKIDSFGGIQPRLDPTSLADTQATLAKNCRLHTTKLHPIQQALKVTDFPVRIEGGLTDVADAKTIEVWRRGENNRDVIAWPGLVTVAPSNIHDDNRFRIFVTGDTGVGDANGENQPCALISSKDGKTYDRHRIFITVPPAASVENSVSMDELDVANLRYAFFFQTWVDEYGYESGMSPVLLDEDGNMVEVQYNDGDSITWKGVAASDIPSGVTKRRLYKTVAGSSEATDSIKFVIEQKMVAGSSDFPDYPNIIVKDEDTGEVTSSITSIPVDLVWMSAMPGNFYVGFPRSNPRQICFSDVNLPTSFPDAYKYSIRDYAMGIAVAGNTAFILTKGYPWAISGTDPNGMTAAQIVSEQACVSARSICAAEGRVYYASQDGICMLAENSLSAVVITRAYWDKASWSALNPSSCIMKHYDNALFCWFTLKDGSHDAYIIDFDVGGNPIITQHDDYASCAFTDVENDKIYFVGM